LEQSNHDGVAMTGKDLEILSDDELWNMQREITAIVKAKIEARMKVIDRGLARLNGRLRIEQISETSER
jgi:hypothetical protein